METSKQLAERIREVLLNGTWIANTNYQDQLSEMFWKHATIKIGALNSIAALTFHINYYICGISDYFESGSLKIKDKYSFDLPAINSKADWEFLLTSLLSNGEKLATQVEMMTDKKLEEIFAEHAYGSYQRNIEGFIEHSYYHLGQITLIKKIIAEPEKGIKNLP